MKKYLLLCLSIIPSICFSQITPASQVVNWQDAGYSGIIPNPSLIVDVTTHGAVPNDGLDDYASVISCISSLNGQAGVVLFPPGIYNISAVLTLPDSIIIRGSGATQTHLLFNFNNSANNCFSISRSQTFTFNSILAGYDKGSKKIIVSNASQNFNLGDAIEIRQSNGTWDTNPASWASNSVGHISTIDSVSADTIYLTEALRITLDASLNPEIRKIIQRNQCGLECFSITRVDSTASSVNYGVYFSYAGNCWISGVEFYKTIGAQVFAEASHHLTITGNYFHDSYLYDGASTRGYGVALAVHTTSCLVDNNIFKRLRHAMMVKQGANGNVFAYNYSREPNRSETINDFPGDISVHGHYPFANLFEGNIVQNIMIDQAWGPAGPHNTFFRNRAELYGFIMSSGAVQSDSQNVVGNDITNNALFMGNYIFYGNGNFQYGNNVKGTIMPSGTQLLTDSSYYLTNAPSFWNLSNPWPNIGTPNIPGATIPALNRYNAGNYAACSSGVFTDFVSPLSELTSINVSNIIIRESELSFNVTTAFADNYVFSLMDVHGKVIVKKQLSVFETNQQIKINLNANLSQGMYLGCLHNTKAQVIFKCLR